MNQEDWKKIIIISAPSGTGKNTLINRLLDIRNDLSHSISTTTRLPRENELNGVHYHFVSKETFLQMIKNDQFLEWAPVLDNYYGTSLQEIEKILKNGRKAILDIDIQGAEILMKKFPGVTTIFITPPSLELLQERLIKRGTENSTEINKRIQLASEEMKKKDLYKYQIENDEIEAAVEKLENIINDLG